MYVCMYVCMYGCMYVCMYVCLFVCLCVCFSVCLFAGRIMDCWLIFFDMLSILVAFLSKLGLEGVVCLFVWSIILNAFSYTRQPTLCFLLAPNYARSGKMCFLLYASASRMIEEQQKTI